MRDLEIVWLKPFDLLDLGLKDKKIGDKAYISESEILRSSDFKRGKALGAFQISYLPSIARTKKEKIIPSQSYDLEPFLNLQKRMVELLETIASQEGGIARVQLPQKLPKESNIPLEPIVPKIEFHTANFGNEIRQEQVESTEVQESLNKLKILRKGKHEKS